MVNIVPSNRIAVVGAGNVGSSIAFSLTSLEICKDILLVDIDQQLEDAQVMDLEDSSFFSSHTRVRTADLKDIKNGDIVVITCGHPQQEGESRIDLLERNKKILLDVLGEIKNRMVFVVVVTNPVDVLTHIVSEYLQLPNGLVFGTGTFLDTVRLLNYLSKLIQVSPKSIETFVVGEHGDSSVALLDYCTVNQEPLSKYLVVDEEFRGKINRATRHKAYEIIKGKGSTYYGIASCVSKICSSILNNEGMIVPLSIRVNGILDIQDTTLGMPAKLTSRGYQALDNLRISQIEVSFLHESAKIIKGNLENIF